MNNNFDLPPLTLVIGGAASGKSDLAENLARRTGRSKVYLATSKVFDSEMQDKVDKHRISRGDDWRTIEADIELIPAMRGLMEDEVMLVDCATMWLTNVLFDDSNADFAAHGLFEAISEARAPIIVVTNELGMSIVPETAMSRTFRNLHGRMNQILAERADWVIGVMAGLPYGLKGPDPKGFL